MRLVIMPYHPLLRPLFNPPSHRRADWLMGFGFGAIWVMLYALGHRLFTLPYGLLPSMLLLKGIAEVLPRSWITPAAILRITSLVAGTVASLWVVLLLAGWL
jgi:hypothetical protein